MYEKSLYSGLGTLSTTPTTASTTPTTATTTPSTPSTTTPSCGGSLNDETGFINGYSYYSYCIWIIEVPYNCIFIYFSSIHMRSNGGICSYDYEYLIIYDGDVENHIELGMICEQTTQRFYTSFNFITLIFVNPYDYGEFEMVFIICFSAPSTTPTTTTPSTTTLSTTHTTASTTPTTATTTPSTPSTTTPSCGGSLNDETGFINGYSYYSYCIWIIEVPYNCIFIYFSSIHMRSNGGICSYDYEYLIIYDGDVENHIELGMICEQTTQRFYTSFNFITLIFVNPYDYGEFEMVFIICFSAPSTTPTTTTPSTTSKL
ncbi:scavenger receptor cysteine-rich domain-containing protein DMBT1-like [Anomaloglossus baeobatrachus]|uniref:scavenger receptor cysteine-rich domain-containing protein DMBT1-like n=1 Tax=Anomaloglossus baeobatrachus TaxID=238106 RepID=UPI003F50AEE6